MCNPQILTGSARNLLFQIALCQSLPPLVDCAPKTELRFLPIDVSGVAYRRASGWNDEGRMAALMLLLFVVGSNLLRLRLLVLAATFHR